MTPGKSVCSTGQRSVRRRPLVASPQTRLYRGAVRKPRSHAWASSVLGPELSNDLGSFVSQYNQPPGGQYTGWHIYMNKDLRAIMGMKVRGKFHVRYCGADNIKRCRTLLWKAIDTLPTKLRMVVVLASIEGHDVKDVASLLGIPKGTVKSRLFVARQRLKEQLQWTLSHPSR